jgi:hypothetical protein
MDNGRMNRVLARSLAVLLSTAVLAGCSGSGDSKGNPDPSASTSSSPTASASDYLPVPEGVTLTPQGSKLAVGDSAVVAYHLNQSAIGVLDLKVTRLERTTFKKSFVGWKLDKATLDSTPFFLHVTVKNVGDTDILGDRRVPLYIVDGTNTLIDYSTFASKFKPCPSLPLPKKFGPGDKTKACLVYLSPDKGKLTAVSFRPEETFDPITWTGEIKTIEKVKSKKGKNGRGGKSNG